MNWLNVWPDEIYGSNETGILAWRYRQQDDVAWQPFPDVDSGQKMTRFAYFPR